MRFLLPAFLLAAALLAFQFRKPALQTQDATLGSSVSPSSDVSITATPHRPSSAWVRTAFTNTRSSSGIQMNGENNTSEIDESSRDADDDENGIQLDADGIRQALDSLVAKNTPGDESFRHRLMERWAASNPEALARWASGLTSDQSRERILGQAVMIWADSDLEAAVAFAKSEPSETTRTDLMLGLAHESLQHDPRRGLELAADLAVTAERDELLEKGVMEWASQDSDQAIHWARQVTDVALRERLIAAAAIGMAENQSFAAASLAATSIQTVQERDRAVVSILQRWVQSEPTNALVWLGSFPEGSLKKLAAQNLAATWDAKDPEAARAWFQALPPSSLKEGASVAFHP